MAQGQDMQAGSTGRRSRFGRVWALLALTLSLLVPWSGAWAQAPIEVRGELDVIIKENFLRGQSEMDYFLREEGAPGQWRQLLFKTPPPATWRTGMRLAVRGVPEQARRFRVDSVTVLPGGVDSTKAPAGEPGTQAVNERRTITLLVDLTNATTAGSGYTVASVNGQMYSNARNVAAMYDEASLGQLVFKADVDGNGQPDTFGPFPIAYDNSTCDYYGWASAAETAAQAAGINLSLYQHRMFIMPRYNNLPACSWAGIANVGCGTFCRSWIAEAESGMVIAHELGHNLNMAHAGTDPGNDGTIDSEYGDYSDPMGLSRAWHVFNAPHIDQMGWYASVPGAVRTVSAPGGVFNLSAVGPDFTSGEPKALKIAKPDSGGFYYLSFRQAQGYDGTLSTTYTKGVNIHRYSGSGYARTSHITTLIPGGVFTDATNGITFTQLSSSGGIATVQVSYGCAVSAPTVALSPASLAVKPGAAASFAVNVTNRDAAGCAATTFSLASSGAVTGTLTTASLTLAAGAIGSSSLAPATVGMVDGTYTTTVTATDSDGTAPAHPTAGQGSATVVVDGTAPSTPASLAGSLNKQGKPSLSWRAATDALSGLAGYTVHRNGTAIAQVTTLTYVDTSAAASTAYTYHVTARDRAGNESGASNSVSLTTSGGKGGGRR